MTERARLEENGMLEEPSDHWELVTLRHILKVGSSYAVVIPIDVARHLKLEFGDYVDLAIRKHQHAPSLPKPSQKP